VKKEYVQPKRDAGAAAQSVSDKSNLTGWILPESLANAGRLGKL
jgi:hypothetical protein